MFHGQVDDSIEAFRMSRIDLQRNSFVARPPQPRHRRRPRHKTGNRSLGDVSSVSGGNYFNVGVCDYLFFGIIIDFTLQFVKQASHT